MLISALMWAVTREGSVRVQWGNMGVAGLLVSWNSNLASPWVGNWVEGVVGSAQCLGCVQTLPLVPPSTLFSMFNGGSTFGCGCSAGGGGTWAGRVGAAHMLGCVQALSLVPPSTLFSVLKVGSASGWGVGGHLHTLSSGCSGGSGGDWAGKL